MKEPITILPFIIEKENGRFEVPMGDAILTLPLAKEGGFHIYAPSEFLAELLELLTDIPVERDFKDNSMLLNPTYTVFKQDSPVHVSRWGTPELIAEFGHVNATLCWAIGIEMKLSDPVPRMRRPRPPEPRKVALFPKGSVVKRSLTDSKIEQLVAALRSEGFNPVVCPHFAKAAGLADFVASCEYAVGVYTGPTHLAAAMGVKTVAIPIGDSAWAYRPLQPNAYVLAPACELCWLKDKRGDMPFCGESEPQCCRSVNPERILAAFKSLDAGRGGFERLSSL